MWIGPLSIYANWRMSKQVCLLDLPQPCLAGNELDSLNTPGYGMLQAPVTVSQMYGQSNKKGAILISDLTYIKRTRRS